MDKTVLPFETITFALLLFQLQLSSLKSFRSQLMSELIQNETASERRLQRLEAASERTSDAVSSLSEAASELDSDLGLLMNTTSFLERLWHARQVRVARKPSTRMPNTLNKFDRRSAS